MDTRSITYVVIPAYEPDEKMVELVKELKETTDYEIIIVNDGSGPAYRSIFSEAEPYAHVISYPANLGKGYALKTAFYYLRGICPRDSRIITADADGQHSVKDIIAVDQALKNHGNCFVLGSRRFSGKIPFKSRAGNLITSNVFRLSTGVRVGDTQTGLRSFNERYLTYMLETDGFRYEYEINTLLKWVNNGFPLYEEPIETIYIKNNASSHFHALRDSFLIYREILKFTLSSFVSFLADYGLYALFILLTSAFPLSLSVAISNISARFISAGLNYTLNRRFVFRSKESVAKTASQYFLLALTILALNTALLTLLVNTILPNRFIAKIFVEVFLFFFSCTVQKRFIFREKTEKRDRHPALGKAVIIK